MPTVTQDIVVDDLEEDIQDILGDSWDNDSKNDALSKATPTSKPSDEKDAPSLGFQDETTASKPKPKRISFAKPQSTAIRINSWDDLSI